jgi:3-dehydroquinate dehydratase-1
MRFDGCQPATHDSGMSHDAFPLTDGRPLIVGSIGGCAELAGVDFQVARSACDLVEIRLDLIADAEGRAHPDSWSHLRGLPLLFTARRSDEGGAGALDGAARISLLEQALDDAALVDIEVASISGMAEAIRMVEGRGIPRIASFHDFGKLPDTRVLEEAAKQALDAGAAAFKAAARLHSTADMARLAEFQQAHHGLPVATMGMGPLAPVSRLLCAQCGSVLNYGFLGGQPTAPGQWDAAFLKDAIGRLASFTTSNQ